MTRQGCCKYCGEFRIVEVADGADQSRIDEKATRECECETASTLKFFSAAGLYEDDQQEFCLNMIRALKGSLSILGVTFKCNGDTFTMTMLAGGTIKVKQRRTEIREQVF